MRSAYYDANYIFKLQSGEDGVREVSAHAATVDIIICSSIGRAEFASAGSRKVREGSATLPQFQALLTQVNQEAGAGHLEWLPLTDAILDRIEKIFASAPPDTYLRAADAIHLATAAEHGFSEIYSNDKHLLAAAPLFGLRGINVIGS